MQDVDIISSCFRWLGVTRLTCIGFSGFDALGARCVGFQWVTSDAEYLHVFQGAMINRDLSSELMLTRALHLGSRDVDLGQPGERQRSVLRWILAAHLGCICAGDHRQ